MNFKLKVSIATKREQFIQAKKVESEDALDATKELLKFIESCIERNQINKSEIIQLESKFEKWN